MVTAAPSQPSAQLQPILQWLRGAEQGDVDSMSAVMSDESYEHIVLPAVLGSEPKSKAAWIERFTTGFASWFNPGDFEAIINEVFEGPGHVTIHMSSTGTTKGGKAFANEYMAVFQVRQDAGGAYKIVRVKEFMDSLAMTTWAKTSQA